MVRGLAAAPRIVVGSAGDRILGGVTVEASLRRTPLFAAHQAAGGKLVPFAGWEMPIMYAGIREEHLAVRRDAGVFDVSHMGQVETRGADAAAALQRLTTGDVELIAVGGSQYGLLCTEAGGVLDDLFTYRLDEERFLTVTNASNHERDLAWMRERAEGLDVEIVDRQADFAMLAVQGPEARDRIAALCDGPLPERFHTATRHIAGVPALVCGTGYTGEDGVELLLAPADADRAWGAILAAGVRPVGLGARDTLRLEACFHLYGNDLSEDRDPIGAGLGWACREATGFIGSQRIAEVRAAGPAEKLVPFVIDGPGIPRQGNPVLGGGVVTSGSFSPCLERGIGLAYVPAERATVGERIDVDVRGTVRSGVVSRKPLVGRKDPSG